jgi:hypothetical protein
MLEFVGVGMRPDFEPDLPHEILENNAQFVLKKLQL